MGSRDRPRWACATIKPGPGESIRKGPGAEIKRTHSHWMGKLGRLRGPKKKRRSKWWRGGSCNMAEEHELNIGWYTRAHTSPCPVGARVHARTARVRAQKLDTVALIVMCRGDYWKVAGLPGLHSERRTFRLRGETGRGAGSVEGDERGHRIPGQKLLAVFLLNAIQYQS